MSEENANLQGNAEDTTIAAMPDTVGESAESGSSGNAPDENATHDSADRRIIQQQQSTIDALLKRTEQLTQQLNQLVIASGVQITDSGAKAPEPMQAANDDDYVSLSDLGKEFGKRTYE